jgi:hypothetical protein
MGRPLMARKGQISSSGCSHPIEPAAALRRTVRETGGWAGKWLRCSCTRKTHKEWTIRCIH